MPVTPNLMRVRRPVVAACPSPLIGRSYLGLLESGGTLYAYRYTDGEYQETLRSQTMSGFGFVEWSETYRAHAAGDYVVFGANVGINSAFVTWDIGAGVFHVINAGGATDRHAPDYLGEIVWGNRVGTRIELYRALAGQSGTAARGGTFFWGEYEDVNFGSLGSLLPMSDGSVYVPGLLDPAGDGALVLAPTGPVSVTGMPELFTSNLDIGKPHSGGSLTFARRQPNGDAISTAGILAASGAWTKWTPLAWHSLGILQFTQPSPSGNEWLLQGVIAGTTHLARFANGVIGEECPLPSFAVEAAPEGVPEIFLCRDN